MFGQCVGQEREEDWWFTDLWKRLKRFLVVSCVSDERLNPYKFLFRVAPSPALSSCCHWRSWCPTARSSLARPWPRSSSAPSSSASSTKSSSRSGSPRVSWIIQLKLFSLRSVKSFIHLFHFAVTFLFWNRNLPDKRFSSVTHTSFYWLIRQNSARSPVFVLLEYCEIHASSIIQNVNHNPLRLSRLSHPTEMLSLAQIVIKCLWHW